MASLVKKCITVRTPPYLSLCVNTLRPQTITRRPIHRRRSAVRADALGICFGHKYCCADYLRNETIQSATAGSITSEATVTAMTRCTTLIETKIASLRPMLPTHTHTPGYNIPQRPVGISSWGFRSALATSHQQIGWAAARRPEIH